jgi:hypothetical protein
MSVSEAVAAYIAEGIPVLPIGRQSKAANVEFKGEVFSLADFQEDSNVGFLLGKGWVDVDLDCREAAQAAAALLPLTRRQGRAGSPGSHYWYFCSEDLKYVKYTNLDGSGLLELRVGENLYTVVPPSIHISGEPIVWEDPRAFTRIGAKELRHAANTVAVATLFGLHWPGGNRHHGAGHLAGFLLRCGFTGPEVVKIIEVAATIGQDEEVSDRKRIARDTAAKFEAKGRVTGGPSLNEAFEKGEDLAAKVYSWLEREGDERLDVLNRRYCISRYGNKAVVVETKPSGEMTYIDFAEFRNMHYHVKIGKVREGEWFLQHPNANRAEEVVFAPPPQKVYDGQLNTWKGFSVIPDPNPNPEQRCKRFLEHLLKVICNEDVECFVYLLDWCAMTVQRPGEPVSVAVVLRGPQGAGKGTFAERFGSLFGPHFCHVSSQQQVTGRFNNTLARKIVVFADEAVWAGSKTDIGNLKRLVTERTLMIEAKFREAMPQQNCVHLIMATNEKWVWPAGHQERRGFVLDVEKPREPGYFDALHEEWETGGAEAFLAFLLAREVPKRLGPVPKTEALEEQQTLTLDPIDEWWLGVLEEGEFFDGEGWPQFIPTKTLYDHHLRWFVSAHGNAFRHVTKRGLSNYVRKTYLDPGTKPLLAHSRVNVAAYGAPPIMQEGRFRGHVLPPLSRCRHYFDKRTGLKRHWDEVEEVQQPLEESSEF